MSSAAARDPAAEADPSAKRRKTSQEGEPSGATTPPAPDQTDAAAAPSPEAAQDAPAASSAPVNTSSGAVGQHGAGTSAAAAAPQPPPPGTDQPDPAGGGGTGTEVQAAPATTQGAYGARESFFVAQEATGEIAFVYIENNGSYQSNVWLIGLKNIFSKQLPNMPKEYITRLVMNRRHRSVGIVKAEDKDTVVGGITYRAFHSQGFGEIAFCAITATEQVKGYGTRLMNFTKEYAKTKDGLTHFLTYADNNAVGYFAKQGFTKEVTMPAEQWTGFIKDYDGGTLMECAMHPKICYTGFPSMISVQQADLEARIRLQSNSHIVYPGLQAPVEGGVRQPIPVASIPGVTEAGWEQGKDARFRYMLVIDGVSCPPTPDNLQKFMHTALHVMRNNEDSWPFHDPVDANDVPDYYEIIKDPVDMKLIEARLKTKCYYITLDIFTADFKRMFSNCRIYNAAETIYAKLSLKLEAFFEYYLSKSVLMQT
mmetsp:Transcript_15954/g.41384  ORF Transcript_15954/g.41384 Transcript_15954/m.41384 type:complete len:482 (+) Transcript_15954:131-1576(+)